jgi:hypothetical protein
MTFEFKPIEFNNLSKSEEEFLALLVKHQKDFSEMDKLKGFLKELFFQDDKSDTFIVK